MDEGAVFEALRRGIITEDQARGYLSPTQNTAQEPQRGYIGQKVDSVAGLTAQGLQGALGNFGDEITAAVATPINMGVNALRGRDVGSLGENYASLKGQANQLLERSEENNPNLSLAANVGGAIASPLTRFAGGATNAVGAGLRSAGIGGIYGLGEGEGVEDRILEGGKQAAFGGALGYGGAKVIDKIAPSKYTEKVGQVLSDARKSAYDLVDRSKAAIGKNAIRNFASNAESTLSRQGYVPSEHTGIKRALEDLVKTPQNELTSARIDAFMKRLDTLRDGQEGLAGMLKRQVGDFADNLTPNQMAYGGIEGAGAIREARKLYAKEMRDNAVDDVFKAVERRGRSVQEQTTFDNEFRKLAADEMFMRGLPEKARKAVERAAEPDAIDRALYRAAGLSPISGGRLGAALGGAAGVGAVSTGNPFLVAPAAVGIAADLTQRARQRYAAELARDLVKNMGNDVLTYEQRLRLLNK